MEFFPRWGDCSRIFLVRVRLLPRMCSVTVSSDDVKYRPSL